MRRSERVAVEIPVVWNRAGRAIHCSASDLNAHGMFLRTDEIIEPGSLMHVKVGLPERDIELFVTARFVGRTTSGQGIGVEIFLIDDVSHSAWITFYEGVMSELRRQRRAVAQVG
jgi:hypothetical protein